MKRDWDGCGNVDFIVGAVLGIIINLSLKSLLAHFPTTNRKKAVQPVMLEHFGSPSWHINFLGRQADIAHAGAFAETFDNVT